MFFSASDVICKIYFISHLSISGLMMMGKKSGGIAFSLKKKRIS